MVTQAIQDQTTVLQENLPPSARDFEAYRLVKVERKSTRAVAKLLHLSQTRVCQLVERVAEYLVDVTLPETDARREKQLAVAKQVAAEHIDYCMQRASHSFERSCCAVKVVCEVENPAGEITRKTTTRENFGETRYLTAIARLALIASTLPKCTLPITVRRTLAAIQAGDEAAEIEAAEVAEKIAQRAALKTAPEAAPPSVEDCSVDAAEQPIATSEQPVDEAARLEAIKLYNRGMRMLNLPEQQLSETVHPASTVPFKQPQQAPSSQQRSELQRKLDRRERRKQRSATAGS